MRAGLFVAAGLSLTQLPGPSTAAASQRLEWKGKKPEITTIKCQSSVRTLSLPWLGSHSHRHRLLGKDGQRVDHGKGDRPDSRMRQNARLRPPPPLRPKAATLAAGISP